MTATSARTHADALIGQIDRAQRTLLRKREQELRDAYRLLTELAYRVAGLAFDECRRADSGVPGNWTPDDWRRFFAESLPAGDDTGWGLGATDRKLAEHNAALKAELARLQRQVAEWQKQLAVREQMLDQARAQLETRERQLDTREHMLTLKEAQTPAALTAPSQPALIEVAPLAVSPPIGSTLASRASVEAACALTDPRSRAEGTHSRVAGAEPATQEEVLAEMVALDAGLPPVSRGFEHRYPCVTVDRRLKDDRNIQQALENHRRRQTLALYILARHGITARAVMASLIAKATGTKEGSKPNAILDLLAAPPGEFVVMEKMSMKSPVATTLVVYRLTAEGRALCRSFGWGEPVESDWERLIRLHQGDREEMDKHTLGVLVFANHARVRGWRVVVMPDIGNRHFQPDVLVARGDERHYVEVEMLDLDKPEKDIKWNNMAQAQGHIAVCAPTPNMRQNIVAQCATVGVPVLACDLETLIAGVRDGKGDGLTLQDPLWAA
jgi:hypothetical protein